MSVERNALAGLKWGSAAKLLTQVASWCVTLVVIRLLSPADYGVMALSAVVIAIVAGLAELGLGASIIQARSPSRGDLARISGALLLFNCASAGVVYLGAPFFAEAFDQPRLESVVQLCAAQLILSALAGVPAAVAEREMRFKWLAAVDIAAGIVTSATTLLLALSDFGVWSLVLGNLGGFATRTAMLLAGGPVVRPDFSVRGMGHFLRFGGTLSGARFAWQLTYQADVLIAGRFLSQELVGLYSVAVQLANLPLQKAMGILNQVAFPAIARLQEELPRMRRRLLDAFRLLSLVAIPVLWGICAVAPEFVAVALGERWVSIVLPLQIIALAAPLRIVSSLCATAMSALGRADLELTNTLVGLAVFAVAFLCGVQWELNGLGIAYAVGITLSFHLNFPRTSRALGITLGQLLSNCRSALISGLAMIAVTAGARLAMQGLSPLVRLPVLIGIGAITYIAMLSLLDRAIWGEARRVAAALKGAP